MMHVLYHPGLKKIQGYTLNDLSSAKMALKIDRRVVCILLISQYIEYERNLQSALCYITVRCPVTSTTKIFTCLNIKFITSPGNLSLNSISSISDDLTSQHILLV